MSSVKYSAGYEMNPESGDGTVVYAIKIYLDEDGEYVSHDQLAGCDWDNLSHIDNALGDPEYLYDTYEDMIKDYPELV